MNKQSLGALIVLNVVLLAALVVAMLTPPRAQALGLGGRQYTMVAGAVTGRKDVSAIYIIDLSTSRLIALTFNTADGSITSAGGRDLVADARTGR